MTIQAKTLNITYEDTTRPITFVYNDEYNKIAHNTIVAQTLYTFKDLIPDYQQYADMTISFNIFQHTEGTLILPPLEFKFTIETLGHGIIEITLDNSLCKTQVFVNRIKQAIEKEIGMPIECTEFCNKDGEPITSHYLEYNNYTSTLFAVFTEYKDIVLQEGYDIIEYKSVFKEGRMMKAHLCNKIGNYRIVKFSAEIETIVKRTPKTIVVEYYENTTRRKINQSCIFGEAIILNCYDIVMHDDRIQYGKEYAIAC